MVASCPYAAHTNIAPAKIPKTLRIPQVYFKVLEHQAAIIYFAAEVSS
jgi:hypothetical protein